MPALAALAVGGYRLDGPSLWRDEAYTISAARRPVGQIFALLGHVDAVHGPYYLCMHFVIGLLGISEVAVRLPSLLCMSIAAGFTAALGRRLARTATLPAPSIVGLLSGLLLAGAPQTTYYAQDARPYGPVVMFAVISTYLLIQAAADSRWRWWVAYGAGIAATGMFNVFALLLVAGHGVTLLLARAQGAGGRRAEPLAPLSRWLAAVVAAVVALAPIIYFGYQQGRTLGWASRPGLRAVTHLVADFAGSMHLIPLVAVIALCGILASWAPRCPGQLTLAGAALPWLVLPPLILISVSLFHPAYVERYVVFCLPGLALLCAAGLAGLARLAAMTPIGKLRPALAWAPSALIVIAVAVMLIGPQRVVRRAASRPDNLRAVAAIVSANERPGDVIFYVSTRTRVVSLAYPAPFQRLRDLTLAQSPAASETLIGTQVSPSTLRGRFLGVRRVWILGRHPQQFTSPGPALDREEIALVSGMRLLGQWHTRSILFRLYAVSGSAR